MISISATSSGGYLSPLQQLQAELQSEVNSGAISSSDQGALSSALSDINSSLQAGDASDPGGGTNSPPGDLKTKIDNLIAGEVSSGKLTSAQATELQGVFQAAGSSSDTNSADDILQQFLQSLQDSLSHSSQNSYSATGSTASDGGSSFSALLINYQT
ncbi:MAG: hypothetical protein ACREC2_14590 [Bradyrhizobium sp.]